MDDRTLRATIGLSASEFNQLAQSFGPEIEKEGWCRYKRGFEHGTRKRKPGGGRIWNLRSSTGKLFFILFYFKCYPTFDVLGLFFNLNRSNACCNVQNLTPILEKVLGKKMALPSRKIKSLEELFEIFPKNIRLWLDLGFTGVDKDYPDASVMMPKKKPRGKELTGKEKAQNKVISSIRVRVEHAIGGIKRMRITTDKFRNKKFRILLMIKLCYFHVGYGIII